MVFSASLSLPAVLRAGSGPVIPKACVSYLSGLIKDASSSAQQRTICQCRTRDFYLAAYIAFESLLPIPFFISPVKPPNSPFFLVTSSSMVFGDSNSQKKDVHADFFFIFTNLIGGMDIGVICCNECYIFLYIFE